MVKELAITQCTHSMGMGMSKVDVHNTVHTQHGNGNDLVHTQYGNGNEQGRHNKVQHGMGMGMRYGNGNKL